MPEIEEEEVGPRMKGDLDHIGVASSAGLLTMRNLALEKIGNTDYALLSELSMRYPFLGVEDGAWKCNAFVADIAVDAGFSVPIQHTGSFVWILLGMGYPPLANDWANGTTIEGWEYLGTGAYPEPGLIVGHPDAKIGHCGIVDYDGWAISARGGGITRKALKMLDGTSGYNKPNEEEQ